MSRLVVLAVILALVTGVAGAQLPTALLAEVAAGFVCVGGGAWYAGRRWTRRRRDVQRVRERLNRAVREASTSPFGIR